MKKLNSKGVSAMKKHFYEYNYYREAEKRIGNLQVMLEYTYNSRQFWLKMFWLQVVITYIILLVK